MPDDGDGNFIIGWNHNRSGDARFRVRTVAAFLPGESKSSGKEYPFQNPPVYRRDSRHLQPPMTAVCLSVATQEGLTQLPWRSSYPASWSTSSNVPWSEAVTRNR